MVHIFASNGVLLNLGRRGEGSERRDDNHCMLNLHSKGCHREVYGLVRGMSGWRSKNSDFELLQLKATT